MDTSPSQIRTAERCKRRWGFPAIEGVYEGFRAKSQHDGDELHSHIDQYVRFGIPFDRTKPMGRLAALSQDWLPTSADDPLVEQEAIVPYGEHKFRVKPDLMWLGPVGPVVMDHKSVAHYGFVHTPIKLRVDLQAVIYAYYAMKKYGEKHCLVVFAYYKRFDDPDYEPDPRDFKPVETMIELDDAMRVLRSYQKLLAELSDYKTRKLPVLQLPPNRDACGDYRKNCGFFSSKCFPGEPLPYPDKAQSAHV